MQIHSNENLLKHYYAQIHPNANVSFKTQYMQIHPHANRLKRTLMCKCTLLRFWSTTRCCRPERIAS